MYGDGWEDGGDRGEDSWLLSVMARNKYVQTVIDPTHAEAAKSCLALTPPLAFLVMSERENELAERLSLVERKSLSSSRVDVFSFDISCIYIPRNCGPTC